MDEDITNIINGHETDEAIRFVIKEFWGPYYDGLAHYLKFQNMDTQALRASGALKKKESADKAVRMTELETRLWDEALKIKTRVESSQEKKPLFLPFLSQPPAFDVADYFDDSAGLPHCESSQSVSGVSVFLGNRLSTDKPFKLDVIPFMRDSTAFYLRPVAQLLPVYATGSGRAEIDNLFGSLRLEVYLVESNRPVLSPNLWEGEIQFYPYEVMRGIITFLASPETRRHEITTPDTPSPEYHLFQTSVTMGASRSLPITIPQDTATRLLFWQMAQFIQSHKFPNYNLNRLLKSEPRAPYS